MADTSLIASSLCDTGASTAKGGCENGPCKEVATCLSLTSVQILERSAGSGYPQFKKDAGELEAVGAELGMINRSENAF